MLFRKAVDFRLAKDLGQKVGLAILVLEGCTVGSAKERAM